VAFPIEKNQFFQVPAITAPIMARRQGHSFLFLLTGLAMALVEQPREKRTMAATAFRAIVDLDALTVAYE
jgi:hypothetical protein